MTTVKGFFTQFLLKYEVSSDCLEMKSSQNRENFLKIKRNQRVFSILTARDIVAQARQTSSSIGGP